MKESVFQKYCSEENINIMYFGVFHPTAPKDILTMKRDENFYLFLEREENPQIYANVHSQITMNQIIMGFSMGILFSIAVLLVLITINEQIRGEYKNLGVLKALGYKNVELTIKYMFYFFIVGVPAFVGYFAGHLLSVTFYELVFGIFDVPYVFRGVVVENMLFFVLVPSVVFAFIAFLWAMFKVRKSALSMIYNDNSAMANKLVIYRNKKIHGTNYLKSVKSILLFSKMMVLIFVLFSGFALGVQIQFAYTTYHLTSSIKNLVLQEYNYEYNVRFKNPQTDDTEYEDSLKYFSETIRLKAKTDDNYDSLNLYVIHDKNTQLLNLITENGTVIDLQNLDGVVINKWMEMKYDLNVGDEISIVLNNEEHLVKVAAVSQSVYGSNIYVGKETAKNQFEIDFNEYNGIYTKDNVIEDDENILSIITKTEMKETIEQSTDVYGILSAMLFICGLVIGTITFMLSLFSVVQSNRHYISLMKVLGYTQKECNFTIISGYRKVDILGFAISIPYTIILSTIMFRLISVNSDMAYPTSINIISIICCLFITIGIVEVILWFFKKRLQKVSFREIMEG